MSNKKLAFIHDLPVGGAKRTFACIMPLLARQFDITVFEFDRPDRAICDIAASDAVSHRRFAPPRLPSPAMTRTPIVGQAWQERRLARAYAAIGAEVNDGGFAAALVAQCRIVNAPPVLRLIEKPIVFYCHEPTRSLHEPPVRRLGAAVVQGGGSRWRTLPTMATQWFANRRERSAVASADALVANSCYSAEVLYRVFGRKAAVAYPGVDATVFHPYGVPSRQIALSVGALHPAKGHDFAISCVAYVPAALRPRLVVASPLGTQMEGERMFLERLAREAGVSIEFQTGISDAELALLYSSAIATIYCPHLEPFGLVSLESMACATPVLGVQEGGLRETIIHGETGFLLPWKAQAFAEKLIMLLEDDGERARIGENARVHVRTNFTWQRCADATASVIESTIASARSA